MGVLRVDVQFCGWCMGTGWTSGTQCRDVQVRSYTTDRATCNNYYFLQHRWNPEVVVNSQGVSVV